MIECKFLPFEIEHAPYGTVAKTSHEEPHYYVQCGYEEINWVPIEKLIINTYEHEFGNKLFIENLLKSYKV